jgi:hypothetical protein
MPMKKNKPSAEAGVLVGKTDINGREGIDAVQPDGSPIRLGGGEIIMSEKASHDNCAKLSEMNVKAGGVAFDCAVQATGNTDRASGKMPKDEWHKESASGGDKASPSRIQEIMGSKEFKRTKIALLAKEGLTRKEIQAVAAANTGEVYNALKYAGLLESTPTNRPGEYGKKPNIVVPELPALGTTPRRSREYLLLLIQIQRADSRCAIDVIETEIRLEKNAGTITDADASWLRLQSQYKAESLNAMESAASGRKGESVAVFKKLKRGDRVWLKHRPKVLGTVRYGGEEGDDAEISWDNNTESNEMVDWLFKVVKK